MPKPFVRVALTVSVTAALLAVAAGPAAAEEVGPPTISGVRECYSIKQNGEDTVTVCR